MIRTRNKKDPEAHASNDPAAVNKPVLTDILLSRSVGST